MASEGPRKDEIAPEWTIVAFLVLAVAVLAAAPFFGVERIPLPALWGDVPEADGARMKVYILWNLRIPRVLEAFLAGTALATGGMVFQAMFRNPLASPFTLGVSSGASLARRLHPLELDVLAVGPSQRGVLRLPQAPCSRSSWSICLTAGSRQGASSATMLLAGVAVSFFFSSVILFLQYMADPTRSFRMLRWVMGGLTDVFGFDAFWQTMPLVAIGSLVAWYLTHELNLLATGEEFAFSRGVNVSRTKLAAVCRRFADGRRGGGRLRSDRVRRTDGPAHLPPAGRAGPSLPVSAFLALRRHFPGGLRYGRSNADGADRVARRHPHRPAGRPLLRLAVAGPAARLWNHLTSGRP